MRFRWVIGLFCLTLTGCPQVETPSELLTLSGETMGTTYQVKIRGPLSSDRVSALQAGIDERLQQVDERMSTWRDDSEISRFNAADSTEWFPVSPETVRVVEEAQTISQASDGAFDVTVRPLLQVWGFGSEAERPQRPQPEQLERIAGYVGYDKLEYRLDPPALRKLDERLSIDLSALAKGFAVDVIAEYLRDEQIERAMVEIGGEVRTLGQRDASGGWRIGIEHPDSTAREMHTIVALADQALATSGDYRQFFELDGQRYSHIIDPRSAAPASHGVASASVVATSCMRADAVATTLLVLEPQAGLELCERLEVDTMLLVRERDRDAAGLAVMRSAGFEPLVQSVLSEQPEPRSAWRVYAIAAGVFVLAVIGMSVGVIFSNRRLRGSCGGLASMEGEANCSLCQACDVKPPECTLAPAEESADAAD